MEVNLKHLNDPLVGLHVRYFDYLGLERFGVIIYTEPYPNDESVRYVYIEDEEPEFNVHEDAMMSGTVIRYAELRLTSEINIDRS